MQHLGFSGRKLWDEAKHNMAGDYFTFQHVVFLLCLSCRMGKKRSWYAWCSYPTCTNGTYIPGMGKQYTLHFGMKYFWLLECVTVINQFYINHKHPKWQLIQTFSLYSIQHQLWRCYWLCAFLKDVVGVAHVCSADKTSNACLFSLYLRLIQDIWVNVDRWWWEGRERWLASGSDGCC